MRRNPMSRGSFFGEYDSNTRSFFFGPAPTTSNPRMKPSSRRTCAMATFMRDEGISTRGWCARDALRMRVSISAMGSVSTSPPNIGGVLEVWIHHFSNTNVLSRYANHVLLPARLRDARNLPAKGELPETDPAEGELANECARPTTAPAPVVLLGRKLRRSQGLCDLGLLGHRLLLRRDSLERHSEQLQQPLGLLIGSRARDDGDFHATDTVDLVVVDLGED